MAFPNCFSPQPSSLALARLFVRCLWFGRLNLVTINAFEGANFEGGAFGAATDDGDGAEGHVVILIRVKRPAVSPMELVGA